MFVLIQHLFPGCAAIGGAEHAALRVGTIRVSLRGYQHGGGTMRINNDAADVARVTQSNVGPGLTAIAGFIHAVPVSEIRAEVGLTAAHINSVGIRWRNGQRSNRADWLAVKNWL